MKHRISIRTISLLIVTFGILCVGYNAKSAAAEAAASARKTEYSRLFSFISQRKQRYYRMSSQVPNVTDGPWIQDGVAGIVARNEGPGLKPVYQFLKTDKFGVRFYYASKPTEVESLTGTYNGAGIWTNQGIAFYLSATELPDTVKLFRLFVPAKIEWKDNGNGLNSVATLKAPEEIFLTTDTAARDKAINAGWKSASLGWIWTKAPSTPLPDLAMEKTFLQGQSIGAVIRNVGSIGSPAVWVRLRILDTNGKQVQFEDQRVEALFNGMPATVVFKVPALIGKRYQVTVDPINNIKESNEANNESQVTAYHHKISPNLDPGEANKLRAPTFAITAVAPVGQKTMYKLAVSNWDRFKPDWFHTLQSSSPNPCKSNVRLQMVIYVIRAGMPIRVGCKPLNSQEDIKSLQFEIPGTMKDSDRVQLVLTDRKDNSEYKSEPFTAGWFGIKVTGCTYFLGRASSFLCATKQSFDDCESLRKQGKPIQCTLRGSK